MATFESVVLGGLELNSGDYTLELFSVPPARKRPEWVSGGDSNGAVLGREALYENRVVQCRVRVNQQATMDLAIPKVGALVDKLQEAEKGGVDCVWTPADSTKSGTLKVLMGEIDSLPVVVQGDDAGWFVRSPVAEFSLTCRPGIRGTEVVGTAVSSTLPLMTVELSSVAGDLPADARIIVTDAAAQSRRHVELGLESLHYPVTSPPGLIIDSDSLVTSGFAGTGTTRSGAYDPGAAGNSVVRATLATQAVAVCGTGVQSHVGSYRVKARVYGVASEAASINVRLAWQDGDGPWRANSYAQPAVAGAFSEVDLGTIRVDPVTLGTQRWQGRIEAYSTVIGDTLDIDYLLLIPVAEGYALVRGEYAYQPGVLVARDEFTGITAGTVLNARVAPLGGTWATSGATTDFTAADAPGADETMTRATVSDASRRLAILGASNFTDTEVGVRLRAETGTSWPKNIGDFGGVVARYVDASNYAAAGVRRWDTWFASLSIRLVVAGGESGVSVILSAFSLAAWYSVRFVVFASGLAIVDLLDSTGAVLATVRHQSAALATGGALATGKPGIADRNINAAAATRYYDDFYVSTPPAEPIALYASQSLEVRHDIALREDSTGAYWGPPPSYRGSRFMVPPAGAGARKTRVAVKARRNDVSVTVDDQIADSLTVAVNYTPNYLGLPR